MTDQDATLTEDICVVGQSAKCVDDEGIIRTRRGAEDMPQARTSSGCQSLRSIQSYLSA
jgi:hypothetical protein